MQKQRISSLKTDEYTLAEGIPNSIDENNVGDSGTMDEIDSKISRVEQLRTSYRELLNELKITLQEICAKEHEEGYEKKLQAKKNYIKNVQHLKKDFSQRRPKANIKQKASKLGSKLFFSQNVKSSITHLEKVFRVDVKVIKEKLICLKNSKMDKISKMLHSLLASSNSVVENQIEKYNEINKMKDIYHEAFNRESTARKISKQKLFNE